MKKTIRNIILAAVAMASLNLFGCWYTRISYNDYIYSVNGFFRHAEVVNAPDQMTVTVTNNVIVDFPLTIDVKLVSNSTIYIGSGKKPNLLKCLLQYRVLPDGYWTTVGEYQVPTGTIPESMPPGPYFGRNNIWPKGCKKGDVIMVRLYVTDEMFQSGELGDPCEDKLGYNQSETFPNAYTLPDTFTYHPGNAESMIENELGGYWAPQYAITVIWSGKNRPVQ